MALKKIPFLLIAILVFQNTQVISQPTSEPERSIRTQLWRDAKFGMFIHWGLYSILGGEWKTGDISEHSYSEWIMYQLKIPVQDYEKLAKEFNPVKFNAEEWVQIAKNAGMKYLVITTKHHDGFSMFDSKATEYDIIDATPYAKDPIKELADACHKQGIKLGFYYSVDRDWHHPDAQGNHLKQSNTWDYPDETKKDFDKYFEKFALPQLTELLTNYGEVSIIWFDGISKKSDEQNQKIIKLVRTLQPECLINSRLGEWNNYYYGDYREMDDNEVSNKDLGYGWENPGTIGKSYGYNKFDNEWKSAKELIYLLVDIVSNGGNYLLNVGPDAQGVIPDQAVKSLKEIGDWLKVNGESIYETKPSELAPPNWGRITTKENKIFLHLLETPDNDKLLLSGLKSKVAEVYFLADPLKKPIDFYQTDKDELIIKFSPDLETVKYDTVIVVETAN